MRAMCLRRTILRYYMHKDQDVKKRVPKLNRDNFSAWKSLMKLHLGGIGDHAQNCITTEHVDPKTPTANDMRKKKCWRLPLP